MHGRLEVEVLDAVAITVSMLRSDFNTAGSVMFLLKIGDILDEWTHKKSVDDLARTMSLGVEQVWMQTADGQELLVPISQIQKGDRVIARTGSMVPLDGKVVSGDAMVNQASMTGESVPVHKSVGAYVYAGTVVEDGECMVQVENTAGSGRYDRIVKMIEESEQMKSSAESKASHLADKLVPWCLGGTLLTYLLTRNATKFAPEYFAAVTLRVKKYLLDEMRETFGNYASIRKDSDNNYVLIRAQVGINNKFYLWLMRFGDGVELVSPDRERAAFLAEVRKMLGAYPEFEKQ